MEICPKCGFKPPFLIRRMPSETENFKEITKFKLLLENGFEFHPSTIASVFYKPKVD